MFSWFSVVGLSGVEEAVWKSRDGMGGVGEK